MHRLPSESCVRFDLRRHRLFAAVAPVLVFLAVTTSPLSAEVSNVTGANGTNGTAGASGSPAGNGTDGGRGQDATASAAGPLDASNSATASGGQGGAGGKGGDSLTQGMPGGQAGRGGDGGNASASALTGATAVGTTLSATSSASGGVGGKGGEGGGVIGFFPKPSKAGAGGAGGNSVGSTVVNGNLVVPGVNATASLLSVGGTGGAGGAAGFQLGMSRGDGGDGGRGGDARGSASAVATGNVNVSANVTGGAGGTANNPFFIDAAVFLPTTATAGNGGLAVVDPVSGISIGGGDVVVSATQTGGAGANSEGAHPGNGASSFMSKLVAGYTTGVLTLSQTANGGSGGYSMFGPAGTAGDAGSDLTFTDAGSAQLIGTSRAVGGHGGDGDSENNRFRPTINGEKGGNATASISLVGPGAVQANVIATGGVGGQTEVQGNGGDGGTASIPTAFGRSTGGGNVLVSATMTGGNGGFSLGGASGRGASAVMSNVVTGQTSGALELRQTATGGSGNPAGGTPAGRGVSTITLTDLVASSLTATATATGGNGDTTPGDAMADVNLTGRGNTTATSTAAGGRIGGSGSGATGLTVARATANSSAGVVRGDATAIGSSGEAVGFATRTADTGVLRSVRGGASSPAQGKTHRSLADTGIGSAAKPVSVLSGVDAGVLATGLPAAADTAAHFADSPNARREFNLGGVGPGPQGEILVLANLGSTADLVVNAQTHTSTLDAQVDVSAITSPQRLKIGLIGAQSSNRGFAALRFRVSVEDSTLVDKDFTDLAAATDYFTDRTLDLGAIDQNVTGALDLSVRLDFTPMAPAQGLGGEQQFLIDMAIGNAAVPEPSAIGLLVLGLPLTSRRRRR